MSLIKKKARQNNGMSTPLMIYLLTVLLIFFCLFMEYVRISSIYEQCVQEVERAANISLEYYMDDEFRQYRLGEVSLEEEMKTQMLSDITSRLDLVNSVHMEGGNPAFSISYSEISMTKDPPQITMKGIISVYPTFLGEFTGPANISFVISTRNIRGD